MLLRQDDQAPWVKDCKKALKKHGNTLGIGATGFGKTVCMSAIGDDYGRLLCLQHTDELLKQNKATMERWNPKRQTCRFNADEKSWRGDAIYASLMTLTRDEHLATMEPVDLIEVDETHHIMAESYARIIRRALELNPDCKLLGVTATANRPDGKPLGKYFTNIGACISIVDLILAGRLVPPRTFVIDIGATNDLFQLKRTTQDFDAVEVEALMNKQVLNEAAFRHWWDMARDRQTAIFCATVKHAEDAAKVWAMNGVSVGIIHGDMPDGERTATLAAYDCGKIQVIFNVFVLTEGWDHQPTSCIVLLKPSAEHSTYIQIVGRGLRLVDPERYPGVTKRDCLILDFGTSTLIHGKLEQEVVLAAEEKKKGTAPKKKCGKCHEMVPASVRVCPLCGHVFPPPQAIQLEHLGDFVLTEVDLLRKTSFRYYDLFGTGNVMMGDGITAWACAIFFRGSWHAVGGHSEEGMKLLATRVEKIMALAAADEWLHRHGEVEAAKKTRRWMELPPTEAQLKRLGWAQNAIFTHNRYEASCHLTWMFNQGAIRAKLEAL
jgi:DNA repair protein RadD